MPRFFQAPQLWSLPGSAPLSFPHHQPRLQLLQSRWPHGCDQVLTEGAAAVTPTCIYPSHCPASSGFHTWAVLMTVRAPPMQLCHGAALGRCLNAWAPPGTCGRLGLSSHTEKAVGSSPPITAQCSLLIPQGSVCRRWAMENPKASIGQGLRNGVCGHLELLLAVVLLPGG